MARLFSHLLFVFSLLVSFEFQEKLKFADNHSVYSDGLSQLEISFRLIKTETSDLDLPDHYAHLTSPEFLPSVVYLYDTQHLTNYIRNGIPIRAPPLVI